MSTYLWIVFGSFLTAIITTILYDKGRKQMKDIVIVPVVNEPTYPRQNAQGYYEHKGKMTVGSGTWDISGQYLSPQLTFYCQKDQLDYSNGNNCTLNPTYFQSMVDIHRKWMISGYVIGTFFLFLYITTNLKPAPRQASS